MKKISLCFASVILLLALASCGGPQGDGKQDTSSNTSVAASPKVSTEPVTLVMTSHLPINDEFNRLYVDPLKKKYPYITLELLPGSTLSQFDKYIAGGQTPDVYLSFNGYMPDLKQRGIVEDMTPQIKSHNVDMNRFYSNYVDDIRYAIFDESGIYGLPVATNFHALYYNKNIFDKFGVSYPKDGMTWTDAIELAKKVTRLEDGLQYRGFDFYDITRLAQPLGLEYVDHKTEKAIVNNDKWLRVFNLGKEIASIPGNAPSEDKRLNGFTGFAKTQNVAMYIDVNIFSKLTDTAISGLNWDVAQQPFYKEQPNTYGNASVYLVGVSKTSKHKEQAFQVMEFFASNEVQMNVSKSGTVSPLNNPEVQKAFASDNPMLKGKNVAGILKSKPVKYPVYLYRTASEKVIRSKFDAVLSGSVDVNTALRQADDEINKAVEEEKSQ